MIRSIVLTTLLAPAAFSALAQDDALSRCRALTDGAARLACYDAIPLAPAAAAQAGPAPAAAATPAARPATGAAPADFGLPRRDRPTVAEAVESSIPGRFDGWEPKTRWRLANGQLWEVTDGSRAAYALQDPKVRIRRGVVGNYLMEIEGVAQVLKVRRIQ
ncbi:hypothetical protein EV684_105286 [Rubrivivax gelatinosus]|uniref:Uncharacterized protein n=2 Tax=Rubrivivax gelatinosus TaxID=28068 RepID=A0A4R2M759_RUBGE|nr:hypothetical protein EV684_105286 [Rubrivivax gelatinosus]